MARLVALVLLLVLVCVSAGPLPLPLPPVELAGPPWAGWAGLLGAGTSKFTRGVLEASISSCSCWDVRRLVVDRAAFKLGLETENRAQNRER